MAITRATAHSGSENVATEGRPVGAGIIPFAAAALRLLDNGYTPLPIVPKAKRPVVERWTTVRIDTDVVTRWATAYPNHGVGLRTGGLVGVDIDLLDPDIAHHLQSLAFRRLGETLVRVGRFPKRLLLYRSETPFPKMAVGKVEILGQGQQFVAFGCHPDTGQPYTWTTGETPLDVCQDDLPLVSQQSVTELLAELQGLMPSAPSHRAAGRQIGTGSARPIRDGRGRVIDGRDGWLSTLAFHAVHDAVDVGGAEADAIAASVWQRFEATTDLARGRQDGGRGYGLADAQRKVADKLRLAARGNLPPRDHDIPEPDYTVPVLSVEAARGRLDHVLGEAMAKVFAWWSEKHPGTCPQIGIKATVGLGKSTASRRHILALRTQLDGIGAPCRIAVFTPSHALAEETAAAWRREGLTAAVLRGYERVDPATGAPLCFMLPLVRAAIRAGLDVQSSACQQGTELRCPHFEGCPKQRNRTEVAQADVVVAPYDALFTGFASDTEGFGLLVIDEGCWQRAWDEDHILVSDFDAQALNRLTSWGSRDRLAERRADLDRTRRHLVGALLGAEAGPVSRKDLIAAGLTAELCAMAARLETEMIDEVELRPGLQGADLKRAEDVATRSEAVRRLVAAWRAFAALLEGHSEHGGCLRLRGDGPTRTLALAYLKKLHPSLRGKPVLHLDATLRPALVRRLLRDLEVEEVEAAAPHMEVRLVSGSFGKSALCADGRSSSEERARRERRLEECRDYVRWQALRGGTTLVITYLACEPAFAAIPGVRTGHFNAIAGLDLHKDVDRLIVIGRPLPRDCDLAPIAGAFFGREISGHYAADRAGIWMRGGHHRSVPSITHPDDRAEEIRRAICDDEVIQAIGRGRGVNRTATNPVEVHVLANLALPLVYDSITPWDCVVPDIAQRMLLSGIAVDSPTDAAALHPELLGSDEQAKKAFERAGFKGQNPIGISYREMSLKSARYRRVGRGRSWQRAWWIDGDQAGVHDDLEAALGRLDGWKFEGSR